MYDSGSRKYMYQKADELDKNQRADDTPYDTSCDGRMHERPESALCPLKISELYLSNVSVKGPKKLSQVMILYGNGSTWQEYAGGHV